jgi:hypothetical protein
LANNKVRAARGKEYLSRAARYSSRRLAADRDKPRKGAVSGGSIMATVITSDNLPAVLAQLVEQLDEQDARIEALTALQADQAIRDEEGDKQFRVQATGLRATRAVTEFVVGH